MLLSNSVTIAHSPQEVYERLLDLDVLGVCLPGGSLREVEADGRRRATVAVKFGAMSFEYGGHVRIAWTDPVAQVVTLEAAGDERSGEGTAKAMIRMSVAPSPHGSLLQIDTDLQITGGIAQMGRGMMEEFSQEMMEQFGDSLAATLGPTSTTEPPTGGQASAKPVPINARKLVFRVIRRRIRRTLPERHRRAPRPRKGRAIDVAIVGSGSGALAAAVALHDAGLNVAIFEKAARVGGGTAYSGGVVWAPCNHVMRRKGMDDSVDDALRYLAAAGDGRGDPAMARQYVQNVGRIVQQVESWTGIKWVIWPGQPDYYPDLPGARTNGRALLQHPNSADEVLLPAEESLPGLALVRLTPHMDFVPGFNTSDRPAREAWVAGRAIIGGLWKAVLEREIPYAVETAGRNLVVERGRVTGIVVSSNGRSEEVRASRGVLLNTGGFDWNETLARRFLPGPPMVPQTPPSNTGDGHVMAMAIGAATALMDKALLHPSVHIPGEQQEGKPLYRMFNAEICKPHSIVVNTRGRRFASEAAYFDLCDGWSEVDHRFRTHLNLPSFAIIDSRYREKYGLPCVRPGAPVPRWITQADTLAELARLIGVEPDALVDEVARYNSDSEAGIDSRFGRGSSAYERYWGDPDYPGKNPTMGPIQEPPFFAFQVHPSHAGTRGGLVTSPFAEVMRLDGSVIPGLYASGNTAANVIFGAGYGSGSAVGSSLVFGFLAAERIIDAA